jgi:hypothetical protein
MIGGTILKHEVSEDIVTFTVKENQSTSQCRVKAWMNEHERKLIDNGTQIWWDSHTIYLEIGDVSDCKFPKVGFSY